MPRRPVFALTALALAAALPLGAQAQGRPDLVAQSLAQGASHVPGELLVQFRGNASAAARTAAMARVDGKALQLLRARAQQEAGRGDLLRISFGSGLALAAALDALRGEEAVDFAEPNWIYTTQASSDDTYYVNGSLWGMYSATSSPANQYGSGAADAWAAGKTCDSSVVIGVIDEGMHVGHKDSR